MRIEKVNRKVKVLIIICIIAVYAVILLSNFFSISQIKDVSSAKLDNNQLESQNVDTGSKSLAPTETVVSPTPIDLPTQSEKFKPKLKIQDLFKNFEQFNFRK